MAKEKDGFDIDKYKNDLSGMVVTELFNIVGTERKTHGEQFADELALSVLCSIAATLALKSLSISASKDSDKSLFSHKLIPYLEMKQAIEDAVGSAFTGAHLTQNPNSGVEFVCRIIKVPPPPSTTPN